MSSVTSYSSTDSRIETDSFRFSSYERSTKSKKTCFSVVSSSFGDLYNLVFKRSTHSRDKDITNLNQLRKSIKKNNLRLFNLTYNKLSDTSKLILQDNYSKWLIKNSSETPFNYMDAYIRSHPFHHEAALITSCNRTRKALMKAGWLPQQGTNSFRVPYLNCLHKKKSFKESFTTGDAIIEHLNSFPESAALIKEAQETMQKYGKSLEVGLDNTVNGQDAETTGGFIRIEPKLLASRQLELVVFELTNVIHYPEFRKVRRELLRGVYKSAEEFARAIEFIEYNGIIRSMQVIQGINKRRGHYFRPYIENHWAHLPLESMGFDHYYTKFLSSSHKEIYREQWRSLNDDDPYSFMYRGRG